MEDTAQALPRADGEWREVFKHLLLPFGARLDPALGAELCCIRPPERLIPVKIIERNADYRARLEMLSEDVRAALRNLPRQSGPDR